MISKNLVIRKRKAFDLKRKVFDLQEYCQNKKKLIWLKKKSFWFFKNAVKRNSKEKLYYVPEKRVRIRRKVTVSELDWVGNSTKIIGFFAGNLEKKSWHLMKIDMYTLNILSDLNYDTETFLSLNDLKKITAPQGCTA